MRLQSKVVIFTGSCTGIGKAIVRRCVAEGSSVVINIRLSDAIHPKTPPRFHRTKAK